MSERHNSDGTAKSTTASKHALLLNRLVQMQDAPYYATAKDELAWAEKIITGQEDTIEQLQAELASVTAGKVTIVKEKFYPADKELIEQLRAEIEQYSIREGKLLRDNARLREWANKSACVMASFISASALPDSTAWGEIAVEAARLLNASADSSNWLQEQKAQWREEIETKHAKSCDGNYIAGMKHGWNLCVNNNDEGFAKAIKLRRWPNNQKANNV